MKICGFMFLMFAAVAAFAAAPAGEERKVTMPRLTRIDAFPENHRDAVRAVIAVLSADGGKPGDYFAGVFPDEDGLLEISLRHQSHPDDSNWRGDQCGRCRIAFYDPKTGKVLRFQGIR